MKNSRRMFIIFRRILVISLIAFLINYFAANSGYYETEMNKRTILTQEKIKEFEEDVKNNEYVDIKDYTSYDYVDTSSEASDVGYYVSEKVSDFVTNKAVKIFELLGKLFS